MENALKREKPLHCNAWACCGFFFLRLSTNPCIFISTSNPQSTTFKIVFIQRSPPPDLLPNLTMHPSSSLPSSGAAISSYCKAKMNSIKTSRWQRSGIQDEDVKSQCLRTADSWRSPGARACVKAQSTGASSVLLIIQHAQTGEIRSSSLQMLV